MKKKFFVEIIIPWIIVITPIAFLLLLYIGGQVHVFKTYGPGIGMIENILMIISCPCFCIPIIILIWEIIRLNSRGKKLQKQEVDIQRISNGITINTYHYDYKTSDGATVIRESFISIYYYKDRKRVIRCGRLVVPALLMFICGIKGLVVLFFFSSNIILDNWIYLPW